MMTSLPPLPALSHLAQPADPCAPEPPKRPTGAMRLRQSSRELVALNIDVPAEPLYVTVMGPKTKPASQSYVDLQVATTRVDARTLHDENGQSYLLDRAFDAGTHGSVCYLRKPDPIRDQIYVAKVMRHPQVPGDVLPLAAHPLAVSEVNNMLRSNSALSPDAVLTTDAETLILLPVLDGTVEHLCSVARHGSIDIKWTPDWSNLNDDAPCALLPAPYQKNLPHLVFVQTARALDEAHSGGTMHRDVKANNILFDWRSHRVYLSDYGISASDDVKDAVVGAPAYLPFEAYFPPAKRPVPYDAFKADIWAVGVVVVEMMLQSNLMWPLVAAAKAPEAAWHDAHVYGHILKPLFEAYVAAWSEAYQASQTKPASAHLVRRPSHLKHQRSGLRKLTPTPAPTSSAPLSPKAQIYHQRLREKFKLLRQCDSKLFGPLLQALNPDARLRPSAKALWQAIEASKGTELPNIAALMAETKTQVEANRAGQDKQASQTFLQKSPRSSRSSTSLSSLSGHSRSHSEGPTLSRFVQPQALEPRAPQR